MILSLNLEEQSCLTLPIYSLHTITPVWLVSAVVWGLETAELPWCRTCSHVPLVFLLPEPKHKWTNVIYCIVLIPGRGNCWIWQVTGGSANFTIQILTMSQWHIYRKQTSKNFTGQKFLMKNSPIFLHQNLRYMVHEKITLVFKTKILNLKGVVGIDHCYKK